MKLRNGARTSRPREPIRLEYADEASVLLPDLALRRLRWDNRRLTPAGPRTINPFSSQLIENNIQRIIPMAIPVGSKAPDFTLKSKQSSGLVDVKLSNNFGKKNTLLLFYPLSFTGVCTQEMCDITNGLNAYKDLNAEVIAVSVDSPFAQEAWAQKEKIGITLASDLNKTTIKAYDVVFPMLAGAGDTAARSAFVIDKNGVVQYSEQTPSPKELPNFKAIKETLANLK